MADASKIRVLVVDDSAVVRHILTDIFASDPSIEVVGTAPNGKIGLAKFEELKPDLVTMDIEMPEMTGLEALTEIRRSNKTVPVIMFSSLTQKGGIETLEALGLGATDYVAKPTNEASGLNAGKEIIREQILQKVRYFGGRSKGLLSGLGEKSIISPLKPAPERAFSKIDIVAIGVSTGGPNALAEVFSKFPENFPVPIVVVQHMPAFFTKVLAERLSSQSAIPVKEGATGDILKPGQAWIAPGGFHMVLKGNIVNVQIDLNEEAPENSCRPSVDPLFVSASKIFGPHVLAVVLTGMGKDGLRGCEEIHRTGGRILAQDEASSVVWGMPRFIVEAGLADQVLPLSRIADKITAMVFQGRETTRKLAL